MQGIDFTGVLIEFVILVLSLTVHEAAHAWSANRLGDPTARLLGRLSLNPVVHVDPIGTIVLPLIAMMSTAGQAFFGWAKPVPVTIANLRGNWKQKYMLIAAAGPASNLLLATLAAIIVRVVTASEPLELGFGLRVLKFVVNLNVLLAVFNLLPVPPLDGGNVLAGLLPRHLAAGFEQIRPYGFLIIVGLAATGTLWTFINPIMNAIVSILLY